MGRGRVLEVRLMNYKSIPGAVLNLHPVTILVGPNGAGKSNVLDALSLLSDAMRLQLRTALEAHGGIEAVRLKKPGARRAPSFGVAVRMVIHPYWTQGPYEARYGFEARAVAGHEYVISRERCWIGPCEDSSHGDSSEALASFERDEHGFSIRSLGGRMGNEDRRNVEPHALLLPLLSGAPYFSEVRDALESIRRYSISPNVMRDLHDPTSGKELDPDGRNIASVIEEMRQTRPKDHRRLCELLGQVVPGVIDVKAVQYGPKRGLQFRQEISPGGKVLTLEASSMSDGTMRVLGILACVFQRPTPLLTGIEEPEATIHPGALGVLMDILKHRDEAQMIITTHSPDLLDSPEMDPRSVLLVQWTEGVTTISPVGPASSSALGLRLATVGELLRSNFLRAAEDVQTPRVNLFPKIAGLRK